MENNVHRAMAIVGVGAVLPDAPNAAAFWENIKSARYSITDVQPNRWDPSSYYDPDPSAPDKTYSKVGGWVRDFVWDPMRWKLPIPPRVSAAMDESQQWAIKCTRDALEDYGYPKRPLDSERTAVILGNAMGGEKHYLTVLRVLYPEYARELEEHTSLSTLPEEVRRKVLGELHDRMNHKLPEITEDTMPGELSNVIAGRIANLFNFHGPNFVTDAACASAMAAMSAAVDGLAEHDFDVAITGGIDRNMGPSTFVKFCKIGALSPTGSRPYGEGADGFVMGEGSAVFVLKRIADAERDGDKIYAVIRGVGGSSDGKGKGITAPNPVGQVIAMQRAWKDAGLSPTTATLIEGHGTSTKVGDVVEVQSLLDVLKGSDLPAHSVALGSVKSNIGHLKSAAGAAGVLKAALACHDKVLPPSVNCQRPNPDIDFAHSPVYPNTELKPWTVPTDGVRRVGVSAFGFGGTNFHIVLEEHIPHRLTANGKKTFAVSQTKTEEGTFMNAKTNGESSPAHLSNKLPLRGAMVIGAASATELVERLRRVHEEAKAGLAPAPVVPLQSDLDASERVAIDYVDAADLAEKSGRALQAMTVNQPAMWKALRAQGIFRGHGRAGKIAFLYTGQGSQYVNMMRPLCAIEPIVGDTFAEADRIMTPILGKPLSEFIFVDSKDPQAVAQAEDDLRQTAITQPAVLATDLAMTRLLAAYGIEPDMTMGHSLGEYGALVAAGGLPFADALEAVAARGREMTRVSFADNGKMAAVFAPVTEIERILKTVDGYVVIANVNSDKQGVIGGASKAVEQAMEALVKAGYEVTPLSVSHAFHTSIVAPASEPLREVLSRLRLQSPKLPIVANVDGNFYPTGPNVVPKMLDILAKQVAAPVQFIKGLRTLYEAGSRIFVETGPKKALFGFAEEVLSANGDVLALFTNHPKIGDVASFNQALCGLYSAGLGRGRTEEVVRAVEREVTAAPAPSASSGQALANTGPGRGTPEAAVPNVHGLRDSDDRYMALGRLFAEVLDRGMRMYQGERSPANDKPIAVTGAALGLPGTDHIFDDENIARILRGEQFIDAIPVRFRRAMLDKHITRLVKSDNGGPVFESIDDIKDVIKLAARGNVFDLEKEFGVGADRVAALDRVTRLAIASGIDALRDAGIPLVMRYKKTSKGTLLPDRWMLPEVMRDDTGIIFASAFPGYDSLVNEVTRYHEDRARREQLDMLERLRTRAVEANGHATTLRQEIERRIEELRAAIEKDPYVFDRRFLFRTLSMGHSQFAEFIGARGPNTQVNSACASTALAMSLAEDWIAAGRCRRVIVVSADDVTSDNMLEWIGAGFLASGAAATDDNVEDAAIPFDRRRHGMLIGMGAAALVLESDEAARERGIRPICEVLSAVCANSAFHGTRLDVDHISGVMEQLVSRAERTCGIQRRQIAPQTVFVSHETYTPARGGSASAEINALRRVFGDAADQIVIANTKGFTGHAMGTGIEEVVAVKALETGCVPPVANFKEIDPELGALNLSKGGSYPVEYALRLAAGFGSQISMTLLRRVAVANAARPNPNALGYAYRIADPQAWSAWRAKISGQPVAELEVVQRTLRIRDRADAGRISEPARKAEAVRAAQASPAPIVERKPEIAQQAAAVAQPPAAKSEAFPADMVRERVLALVAEKTGYPQEMLDLDLDLEADLGIDTVKQAEVFAAIREAYGIPRDDKIKLRDFPTLAHVIKFVLDRRPDLAKAAASASPNPEPVNPGAVAKVMTAAAIDPRASIESNTVKERILTLVAEKTGYPRDMLDLDLDMEADLGIDTVKQAEMFAAIRESYNIPRDPNLKLRDFPTIAHVIRFVYDRRPDLMNAPPVASAKPGTSPASAAATSGPADPVKERILTLVAEKTGYPRDMLDLDLDMEADLGIDTVKQAEMFAAIRESYNIPRDPNLKLRDFPTVAHVIGFVHDRRPDLTIADETPAAAQPLTAEKASTAVAPTATTPDDPITEAVLKIVAEKTGYPREMLDIDLDLEADLGIDTVKQAEMFAAIRATYNIPRDPNLKLRDFPTLKHVIQFACDRAASQVRAAEVMQVPRTQEQAIVQPQRQIANFEATEKIPRRVPVPVLRPSLQICKTSGVTLNHTSRVVLMPDEDGVASTITQLLKGMGVEVLQLKRGASAEAITSELKQSLATGPIHGVYWLPALDPADISAMNVETWHKSLHLQLKSLYATMRSLSEQPNGVFLVSAVRLGGVHGYDDSGAFAPLGGAVTGFTKAYKREHADALVKAVDFDPKRKRLEIAELLIEETLRDPGAVEIGYKSGLRWTIGLQEQPVADGQPGVPINNETVFVVTGAAGSIVSAITADLAAASGGKFYLLDLVPEPDRKNPDLQRFVADKEGLKRDLFERIKKREKRATPAMVEKELAALERAQAAASAMQAVEDAGGTAHYCSVDLIKGDAVEKIVREIRARHGRIDVLLHAAGIERSHFLPDKPPKEFDLVFDVKTDGWFNLMKAIGDMPLGATVAFSSVAGRFGNGGQTDYSSANDLLCKLTSNFRTMRPSTRGIVIDWTAWSGIGMATRGSIPKMMEVAGIDMLPPEAGIPWIRRELTAGGTRGEVVVGSRLGIMTSEFDPTGGLAANATELIAGKQSHGPMVGKVAAAGIYDGVTIETELDPKLQAFLYDHQIDNTPVLPGVMGIEAFAEAASAMLPGWNVEAIENVEFMAPFKFYRHEPRTVTTNIVLRAEGDKVVADCRLIGHRLLPNQKEPQPNTHFTARVRMTRDAFGHAISTVPHPPASGIVHAAEIYKVYFHGPAYQVLSRAWRSDARMIGELTKSLPANHSPADLPLLSAPRLIELCFQTAGLWEMREQNKFGLPLRVDRLSVLNSQVPADAELFAVVTPQTDGGFDAEVVGADGTRYLELQGYRTIVLPTKIDQDILRTVEMALT